MSVVEQIEDNDVPNDVLGVYVVWEPRKGLE